MKMTKPSKYHYKRYRITKPAGMHVTTIAFDPLENIILYRKAGGASKLSAIVHAEAERLRATGEYTGSLSAAVRRAVQALLG